MSNQIGYWRELSDYDIETADAMLKSKRYLYVGFMSHQSIEKILKAYFIKINGETAPFSHSLSYLAKKAKIYEHFSVDVAIVVDKLQEDYFLTTPLLWRVRREVDDRIEPVILEKNNDESGFLEEVMKNGILI
ncbi:MAG TPA: HEPN domain-containing protein [Thermodesulfovibrionia bacterium]|nr:HEPN domain-containing protein [Thermodesulfovibrionia bacterium]